MTTLYTPWRQRAQEREDAQRQLLAATRARPAPQKCPKTGCTQRTEAVLDAGGSYDPDWLKCLFHGEVFVGKIPKLDEPGDSPRGGVPMFHGVRL